MGSRSFPLAGTLPSRNTSGLEVLEKGNLFTQDTSHCCLSAVCVCVVLTCCVISAWWMTVCVRVCGSYLLRDIFMVDDCVCVCACVWFLLVA